MSILYILDIPLKYFFFFFSFLIFSFLDKKLELYLNTLCQNQDNKFIGKPADGNHLMENES